MPCPICHEDSEHRYRPFCSKRCADIDLGRWFNGSYKVAGNEEDDEASMDEAAAPPSPPLEH